MKYDYKTGCAYPAELNYAKLPKTLVEVSEEDHAAILSRGVWDTYQVREDGTVTITKGEEPNGNPIS